MTGSINAFNFVTDSMKLTQGGIGDVEIFVLRSLDVAFTSFGDVYCKGNPESVTQSSTGFISSNLYLVE